jgi:hypothetical protein
MLDPNKYKAKHVARVGKFRAMVRFLNSLRIITDPGSGLESEVTPSGTKVWIAGDQGFFIRITARDGVKYAWNAVHATPGGTWEDFSRPSGSLTGDWAVEANGLVASLPQIVLARREEHSNRVTFEKDTC